MKPRAALPCLLILALSGCGFTTPVGMPTGSTTQAAGVLDVVSVVNTQKTLDDHVVGWVLDKDCSTIRASQGDTYCEDIPKPVPVVRRVTYCYRTLAAVSCYDRPIASDAAQLNGTRVDNVPITQN